MIATLASGSALYAASLSNAALNLCATRPGLYKMDLDMALDAMTGDRKRDALVIGRTKEQLRDRFEDLRTVSQVSEYYRDGYNRYWQSKDVLFIRNSSWMVVFDRDRATDLVLMKGY